MGKAIVYETIKQYFKTTTLHGFKYLLSIHFADRVAWLAACGASAGLAGVLCAVLWARFAELPALLALAPPRRGALPAVLACPPPDSVADMFLRNLSPNSTLTKRIPITLARLLTGKSTAKNQLLLLDELLASKNVTLPQVLMDYTPSCNEHMKRCRYQQKVLPCEQLFEKELTYWGMCCVMRPDKLSNVSLGPVARSHITQTLDLVLQCTHSSTLYGCQFVTIYEGEEWAEPETLIPGYFYVAQLRFTAIPDNSNTDKLLENTCVHDTSYSRTDCLLKCAEKACGCSDPLHFKHENTNNDLPMCTATRMACLRAHEYTNEDVSCRCLPSCTKISTDMVLEPSPMNVVKQAIDPLYLGLNVTASIVVNLRVNVGHSRVFLLNPTETWLTLLSSLGGVFNMFLGVGLFSALEFLFLVLVKLPVAIRKGSEIDPTARYAATPRAVRNDQ